MCSNTNETVTQFDQKSPPLSKNKTSTSFDNTLTSLPLQGFNKKKKIIKLSDHYQRLFYDKLFIPSLGYKRRLQAKGYLVTKLHSPLPENSNTLVRIMRKGATHKMCH